MQRAWATGSGHDQGPMEWISTVGPESTTELIRAALEAATAPDATIAQCQTGLLAVECVTYLHGGDADLDPLVHVWMRELHPELDEPLRVLALETLAKLRATSTLATHWKTELADREATWLATLDELRDRLATAKRKPDPRKDPRIVALGKSFKQAQQHLRVALVPYEITDEPIAHLLVAPGLSVVVHYDGIEGLEPMPVPIEHLTGWNRSAKDLAKLAAKRTREVTEIRTHIMEHEGFEIALVFGANAFTAGLLPYANLVYDGPAPHGVVIGAPFAGALAYHRIVDAKWSEAVVELVNQIKTLYEPSPERISRQMWWLHKGKLVELPYGELAGQIMIQPIDEFVAAVKKLG